MSEPVIHTVPAETSIYEDVSGFGDVLGRYYRDNRDVVLVICAVGVAVLLNRAILRRELRRLNFSAEFFPFDSIDGDEVAESLAYLGE